MIIPSNDVAGAKTKNHNIKGAFFTKSLAKDSRGFAGKNSNSLQPVTELSLGTADNYSLSEMPTNWLKCSFLDEIFFINSTVISYRRRCF